MADSLATKAIQALGQKQIHLENDDLRIQLVDTSYVVNLDTHDFLDDVPSGNRVGTAVALSGKNFTDGIFNATTPLAYGVTTVVAQGAWIYQHDTATPSLTLDSQRRLIFWIDGQVAVTLAASVALGATTLPVDPLEGPVPSGTTFTIGGQVVTTNALAAEGARTIFLSSGPGSALGFGATGEANKGFAWPIPSSPAGVTINFNTGANKIFRVARRA